MGLSVQTHPDKYEVTLYAEAPPSSFAVVKAIEGGASVSLFLQSTAKCDELIAAACEAKRLLETAQEPPEPVTCGYEHTIDGEVRYCTRPLSDGHVHAGADSHVPPGEDPATAAPAQASADAAADWPGTAPDDGQTYSGEPDPFGPEAYKTHRPGCACPDCQAAREDEAAYVDIPSPHSDDCDCEACITFYAERNKA